MKLKLYTIMMYGCGQKSPQIVDILMHLIEWKLLYSDSNFIIFVPKGPVMID